tara:strand:- start:2111 stop:2398 length:288 start_codon:yes stop_codon:yes gene_type:complete
MTYVYETTIGGRVINVEYVFSSVSNSIKVVDMTADGEFHRMNWMSDIGRNILMEELEADMEDRMCGTGEYSSEIDLDRDMPGFEGTMETLNGITV